MTMRAPFNPQRGANQEVTATSTSASVEINAVSKSVRIVNSSGTHIAHVRIGTSPQTATTADVPVRGNSEIILSKAEGEDTIAYISAGGTVLQIQTGEGGV